MTDTVCFSLHNFFIFYVCVSSTWTETEIQFKIEKTAFEIKLC